jgi:hypothetical protein
MLIMTFRLCHVISRRMPTLQKINHVRRVHCMVCSVVRRAIFPRGPSAQRRERGLYRLENFAQLEEKCVNQVFV